MKAVRIHKHGGVDVLKYDDIPTPTIRDDQVLVKIRAAAMNHLDLWVRKGIPGVPLPCILGSDGAGCVVDVGSKVTSFHPGDRVMIQPLTYCGVCHFCQQGKENYCDAWGIFGENQDGTQCEYMAVDETHIRSIPDHLDFVEASAFSLVAQTALAMLVRRAKIQRGEAVFIWGGTSGVGSIGIQIAKARGAIVYTATGSEKKSSVAKELGADEVVNYTKTDIVKWIMEKTNGRGVDVVMEHVGALTWRTSMNILGKGGRLVTCGATTGPKVNLDIRHLFYKQQSILGSTMGDAAAMDEALDLLKKKKIRPLVDRTFPMKDIKKAHTYLEQNKQIGKVALIP
ncbi:MAG: zinc-binding dehydrogenase [Candidatus Marinimicrobia bacterium]|nr:zinc-binding dehydrogenase [Candidatus Neomarinimicrobiota bacterium]MBL7059589.1 zinc-binding dehydrogenase [Candidatus Neomarinimicrobiota bacterium]